VCSFMMRLALNHKCAHTLEAGGLDTMRNSGSSRFGKSKDAKIPSATAPFDAKQSQDGTEKRGCVSGEGGAVAEKSDNRMTHDRANLRVAVAPRSSRVWAW
jgi:hypothetical protein